MHKQIIKTGVLAVTAITLLTSCGLEKTKETPLAKVNRQVITDQSVSDRISSFPENTRKNFASAAGQSAILEQLINEELLHQEAKKSGYEKNEDYKTQVALFKKQLETAKQQALIGLILKENVESKITLSEEEVAQYYNSNPTQFAAYEQRKASHILLKTKANAAKYRRLISQKKAKFSTVAEKHSIDPTGKNGGDLGWFKKGDLVPEFEKAAYALKYKGHVSPIVKTQFGYHIIKLTDKKNVEKRTLKEVKGKIQQALYSQKRNNILGSYIETLKTNHKITKIEEIEEKEEKEEKEETK
jgi:peptidyl-prolyl cis-trans isomerase C